MEPHVEHALRAIDLAVDSALPHEPEYAITPDFARMIERVLALPENQDGADKSWVWPAWQYLRRHFRRVRPA